MTTLLTPEATAITARAILPRNSLSPIERFERTVMDVSEDAMLGDVVAALRADPDVTIRTAEFTGHSFTPSTPPTARVEMVYDGREFSVFYQIAAFRQHAEVSLLSRPTGDPIHADELNWDYGAGAKEIAAAILEAAAKIEQPEWLPGQEPVFAGPGDED